LIEQVYDHLMDEAAAIPLQARIADLCGHLNVLHAQMVQTVVEAVEGDLWMQSGIKSVEHWLAWQTGLSPAHAKQLVDTAHRAGELPVTFAAFADGELSVDQVAVVAKHTPAHNDAEVCELAKSATVNQLRAVMSRYVHTVGPQPQPEPEPVVPGGGDPRSYLWTEFDEHSRFVMHVNAPADQGAVISQAIAEARDAMFLAGHTDVTFLEALIEVCNRSLTSIASKSRRDRFRIYVHLATDDVGGPAHAWFNGGVTLPDAIRDSLLCDGIVQPLWHTQGLPINVGRTRYIVPPHTRRAVLDRDRVCRYPGCNSTVHLEAHHINPWLQNGHTNLDNLARFCSHDHDAHHRGEFTMIGNANIPGELKFYDRRGRLIPEGPQPNQPTGPPPKPPPGKKYNHPTGEHFDTRWFTLTDAPVP
jgi:hypothetical protein